MRRMQYGTKIRISTTKRSVERRREEMKEEMEGERRAREMSGVARSGIQRECRRILVR